MRPRNVDLRGFAAFAEQLRRHDIPELLAPRFAELDSGLLVPSSVADRIEGTPPEIWLPPELRTQPQPIAVVDNLPMSADQFAGALNEEELGLPRSTLDELIDLVRVLPFERCILLAARVQAKLYDIREDAAAQLDVLRAWGVPGLAEAVERVLERHQAENRRLVIFAEQYLTVLQRLLVEHAAALTMDYEPTDLDLARMIRAVFAAATVTSSADADLQEIAVDVDPERWLIYTLKNGVYNARPPLVNEITRARELFAILAPTLEHDQFVPIDDWFREDYGLTAKEQLVAGQGAAALVHAFNDEIEIADRSLTAPPQWRGELEDRAAEIEALLSAPRDWFAEDFAELSGGLDAIAWERRPFLRRPFLRFENGQWMLIAPRMIGSWLGEGVLHRVIESAQRRNLTLQTSRFIGALFERYCLDLSKSAYGGERPVGAGRVHGEQPYGTRSRKMTSDVAIDLGVDLVLVEVVSSRLTAEMQVFGNGELLEKNLERMLFKKIRQIGDVISDVLAGTATIPDVDRAHIERVWPVVVTAGELMQSELLWDQIDERSPDTLRQARVAPLSVFDIGDFELLLALVGAGYSITDILRRKAEGPYRRLEISRLAFDEFRIDPVLRLPIIDERWNELWAEMLATLDLREED
jgi:hypothetical protein